MSILSWRRKPLSHDHEQRRRYREFLRRWTSRPRLSRLEDRVTPAATLFPSLETSIVNGLNSIASTMDTIDTFGQFASNLPVVGQSIGNVLDFGKRFKDELLTPVQTYFA